MYVFAYLEIRSRMQLWRPIRFPPKSGFGWLASIVSPMKFAAPIAAIAMSPTSSSDPHDDTVDFFGQQMPRDWAEMLAESQLETQYRDTDGRYDRIPYGRESFISIANPENMPCRHCNTISGKLHEPGCDYEQCPKCNSQIMTCDCEFIGHEWREQPEQG